MGCCKNYKSYQNYEGQIKIIPMRCNDRIGCPICAREYSRRKIREIGSLLTSIIQARGEAPLLKGELTIPKSLSSILETKEPNKRKVFFDAGCKTLKTFFPNNGIYFTYHNWGCKNGKVESNWHIHFLILPWMPDAVDFKLFIPRDDLLKVWQNELVKKSVLTQDQANLIKDVNVERIVSDSPKYENELFSRIEYMVRQPIQDVEKYDLDTEQKSELIALARRIPKNFRRFRWLGWLSNRNMSKGLLGMKIARMHKENILYNWKLHGTGGVIEIDETNRSIYKPTRLFNEFGMPIKATEKDCFVIDNRNCFLARDKNTYMPTYKFIGKTLRIDNQQNTIEVNSPSSYYMKE